MKLRSKIRQSQTHSDRAWEFARQLNERFPELDTRSFVIAVRDRGVEWLRESEHHSVAQTMAWAEHRISQGPPASRPISRPESQELSFPGDRP